MTGEEPKDRSRWNTPLDRRDFLKLTSALGASVGVGSLLAGATPGAAAVPVAQPTAAGGTPKRGGTFRFPVYSDVTAWPPVQVLQNLLVNKAIFNALVRYGPDDWTPQPELAEKWEVSRDGLTWTFTIRKGVTWHDGKPFTAADAAWSMDVYRDPQINSTVRGSYDPIRGVEAPDATTLKIVTKEPYSSLVEQLGFLTPMMPKHLLAGREKEWNPAKWPTDFVRNPVGTGPFKFVENVSGDHVTVVANENYWEGRPYLDQVIFKVVRDGNARVSQVRTGELDFVNPAEAQLAVFQGANVQIFARPKPEYYYTGFNYREPTLGKFFSDKKFRIALAQAIDAKGILQQAVNGKGDLISCPIGPAFKPWYPKNAPVYEYNPEKAGRLLAEYGFKKGADGILEKDGTKLSFSSMVEAGQADRQQMALITQQNLKDLGIDFKILSLDLNTVSSRRRVTKDYQATSHQQFLPATPDLRSYFTSKGSTNDWPYSNPEVDRLFQEVGQVFEYEKRKALFDKIYTIIAEDQPVIFHINPREVQVWSPRVRGIPPTHYRDVTLWLHKLWLDS